MDWISSQIRQHKHEFFTLSKFLAPLRKTQITMRLKLSHCLKNCSAYTYQEHKIGSKIVKAKQN